MFTETLSGRTKETLALLGKSHLLDKAYLAGGSGLALQLGHRISIDLDFFTPEEFEPKEVTRQLQELGKYPVLFPFKKIYGINVSDLRDIAAMKIEAIACRGTRRDFIDLYFICQRGVSLEKTLSLYNRKFGKLASNIVHIQKSLIYFFDAESEEMPKTLKPVTWEEIKRYFEQEVRGMIK